MIPAARLALLMLLLVGGCADEGTKPDHSPDWYVPYAIRCAAACPATHDRSELSKCNDAGRSEDQTAGCQSLVIECYCVARRAPAPKVLP